MVWLSCSGIKLRAYFRLCPPFDSCDFNPQVLGDTFIDGRIPLFIKKSLRFFKCRPFIKVAGPTRLELATSGVTGRHSNQLNYDPAFKFKILVRNIYGRRNRARTCDPRLVRPVLSQLSYPPLINSLIQIRSEREGRLEYINGLYPCQDY